MSTQKRDESRAEKSAAVQAELVRQQRNQRIGIIVGILVVLGAIVAAGTWYSTGKTPTDTTDYSGIALTDAGSSIKIGSASAPVKVVIYEDFLCPYCRQLEDSTRDFLRESAAKDKVQVEYRPINILTQTTYSARAMNTWAAVLKHATPAAAMKLHDLLYENQPYEQSADQTTDADLMKLVKQAGGDNSAVVAATQNRDTTFFAASAASATQAGVQGTPTVLINGKRLDNMSVDQIVAAIEDAVSRG